MLDTRCQTPLEVPRGQALIIDICEKPGRGQPLATRSENVRSWRCEAQRGSNPKLTFGRIRGAC